MKTCFFSILTLVGLAFMLPACNDAKTTSTGEHTDFAAITDTVASIKNSNLEEMSTVADLGETNPEVKKQLSNLLKAYFEIKNALVATDGKLAKQKATGFLAVLSKVDTLKMSDTQKKFYQEQAAQIKSDVEQMSETEEFKHQREHLATFSTSLYGVIKRFQAGEGKVFYDFCPMAMKNKGAFWLSEKEDINNPYFGDEMLTCGEVKETF